MRGVLDTLWTCSVGRHLTALLMSFFDDHAHLVDDQCGASPVGVDFDQISAMTDPLAHSTPGLAGTAHHLCASWKVCQVRRTAEWIILTDGRDSPRGHLHTRAVHQTLLNGIS